LQTTSCCSCSIKAERSTCRSSRSVEFCVYCALYTRALFSWVYTLCSEKNTHSYFLSYLHDLFVDLNEKCSEYTQGLRDSDTVKIRYSLRSMT